MTRTVTPPIEGQRERSTPRKRSWLLASVVGIAILAVAAVVGVALLGDDDATTGDNEGFTYVYELDGDLDDAKGGPALVATGGSVGPEGFVFEPGDGLTADVDLGDSYTIEMRIRIDESGRYAKLFDFADLSTDSGLYVHEESQLIFWFVEGCDKRIDEAQGCPLGYGRHPLVTEPSELVLGEWATVRFARDGETGALSAEIDGTAQTWQVRYPPFLDTADLPVRPVDNADDFMGEATQAETVPLHLLFDDRVTSGSESGGGELDYLKIAIH